MNLKQLQNKKICILGLGIENYALVKYLLKKKVKADITICDARTGVRFPIGNRIPKLKWKLGEGYDKDLGQYDIIFRIAGYPLWSEEIKKARHYNTEIFSPAKLFFDLCPTKNIIGVTGTKGKGTTSGLIYAILKSAFVEASAEKRVFWGGNIGTPMFSFLEKIRKNDWVVLELSSFQLEDLHKSPRIAVMTNFTKEHLASADPNNPNYHRSLGEYWDAKANVFTHQAKIDKLVVNKKLDLRFKNMDLRSKIVFFEKFNLESRLIGEHNKENIAAAVEVARLAKIKMSMIKEAVKKFKGLEHRLEFVKKINGVEYYDSSFATTPETAIVDMKSFPAPIILLAGGADKGSDFKGLAREIKKGVKFVVLLDGKATPRLKKELLNINYPKKNMVPAYDMHQAVVIAKAEAGPGDIVLLSPACASFGMFKNYKERGILFKESVRQIKP